MRATHWIQSADFSSKELGEADQFVAVRLLREHSWPEELRALADLEAKGEECCPPGLGLVGEGGDILHFCPGDDGKWLVHYHYSEPRKILGIIPSSRDRSDTATQIATARAEQMVSEFLSGQRVTLA